MHERRTLHRRSNSIKASRYTAHTMKNDRSMEGPAVSMAHHGLVSVPGPANSDAYAIGGDLSDEEGGQANGYYLDPIKDAADTAAEALLGGNNSSSKSNTKANANFRKGHSQRAANDFSWWKSARIYAGSTIGQANWYIKKLARQQNLRVVKSREKAATDADLAALHSRNSSMGGSSFTGKAVGSNNTHGDSGGCLHDSAPVDCVLSGLGTGMGETDRGQGGRDVELVTMEAGNGSSSGGGSSSLIAQDDAHGSRGGRGGNSSGVRGEGGVVVGVPASSMVYSSVSNGGGIGSGRKVSGKRLGKQTTTTGDLVKLLENEERAPNSGALPSTCVGGSGGFGGTRRFPEDSRGWKAKLLPRTASVGGNMAHISREDRWSVGRSFKVLGVEIGYLDESQQFMVCAGGVISFLLVYGYMQEYLVVKVFQRELGLFLTLLQFFGYATYACLRRCVHREVERKIPLSYYFFLGLLQACMQGLTNVSMMFLNYPAKVLFKSSRMVPIMCFGVLWQGRKYAWTDYVVVFLIVTGLVTFMNADTRAAADPHSEDSTSLIGVALISLALVIDAALINIQEEIMNKYDSCQDELILFSYLSGTVFMALACLYTGDLAEGGRFVYNQGMWCILAVMLFAGAGFLGVSCVAALTKRFGALASAITTTARKAGTLLLSFVFFPKVVTPQHYCGAGLFIIGLVIKSTSKKGKSGGQQHFGGGGGGSGVVVGVLVSGGKEGKQQQQQSPAATPISYYYEKGRKRLVAAKDSDQLDVSTEAPLLSDAATGGGSSSGGGGHGGNNTSGGAADNNANTSNGPAALSGNSGGYPVQYDSSGTGHGVGRGGGHGNTRNGGHLRAEGTSVPMPKMVGVISPRRRNVAASPPVTGLGFRA